MNVDKVAKRLAEKYPDVEMFVDNVDGFCEFLAEIEPTKDHEDHSVAVAIAGKSRAHYHNKTTEVYEVMTGNLTVFIDGEKYELTERESVTINPGSIHWVHSDEAWFMVTSTPGWTMDDHIIIGANNTTESVITDAMIASAVRYLEVHNPKNANDEYAMDMLKKMRKAAKEIASLSEK